MSKTSITPEEDGVSLGIGREKKHVTIELQIEGKQGSTAQFVHPFSGDLLETLRETSLHMEMGLKKGDNEKSHRHDSHFKARLHYVDKRGIKVEITSREQLNDAIVQYRLEGILTIVGSVEIKNTVNQDVLNKWPVSRKFSSFALVLVAFCLFSLALYHRDHRTVSRGYVYAGTVKEVKNIDKETQDTYKPRFRNQSEKVGNLSLGSFLDLAGLAQHFTDAAARSIDLPEPSSPSSFPECEGKPAATSTDLGTTSGSEPFTSLEELQRAFDEYLFDRSPNSLVARTYGFPASKWDLSQLKESESFIHSNHNLKVPDAYLSGVRSGAGISSHDESALSHTSLETN